MIGVLHAKCNATGVSHLFEPLPSSMPHILYTCAVTIPDLSSASARLYLAAPGPTIPAYKATPRSASILTAFPPSTFPFTSSLRYEAWMVAITAAGSLMV